MKKVIRLTESDLARIVKRVLKEAEKELPVKPDGTAYTYADFTDRSLSSRLEMSKVPMAYDNKMFNILFQGGEGVDFKNFNVKQFCQNISGGGYDTLLQPLMKQTQTASIAIHPPVKYVCDSTQKYIMLVPINNMDAEQIVRNGGIDYRQENLKHLIKDRDSIKA